MKQEAVESAASLAGKVSYTTSGGLMVYGVTVHDWSMIVGIFLAVATFAVNLYYQHRQTSLMRAKSYDRRACPVCGSRPHEHPPEQWEEE